eukprot:gene30489-35506_t
MPPKPDTASEEEEEDYEDEYETEEGEEDGGAEGAAVGKLFIILSYRFGSLLIWIALDQHSMVQTTMREDPAS